MLLPVVAGLLKVKMFPEIDRSDNSFVASASASFGLIITFPPFTKEIIFPVASIDKSCVSCWPLIEIQEFSSQTLRVLGVRLVSNQKSPIFFIAGAVLLVVT